MARLGDVVKIEASSKSVVGERFWLLNLDMVEQQTGNVIDYNYVGKDALNGSIIQFDTGCVLYSKLRPNLNKVVIPNQDGFATSEMLPLRPNTKMLTREYLTVFLRSDSFVTWAVSKTAGAKMPRLGSKELLSREIPLPSISEQIRIAEQFEKISELISLRKEQLAKLDQLVKSQFIELFGDPKINPHNYPVCQLSDYIEFLTSGSRGWARYCKDEGSEWFITIKNVKDCHISTDNMQSIDAPDNAEAKRTKVHEGDLLISITADLGRTGVVTKEIADHGAYINQHLTCIRLRKDVLNPLYVAYFMESPAGKEQFVSKNQSAVKAGLNFNSINSLRLLVPPMEDQTAFMKFCIQVSNSKLAVQKGLEELELLKKALMQKYFG